MKNLLGVSYICCIFLCGCNPSDTRAKVPAQTNSSPSTETTTAAIAGNAMTIDYRIIIGKQLTPKEKKEAEKSVQQVFQHVDMTYNKWNPLSEVSKLNRLKAGMPASISTDLEQLLQQVDELVALTEGRFDPTIEPLQQLWRKRLEEGTIPTEDEIEAVVPSVGWKNIHFEDHLFVKDHDLTSLDLGGIAKGHCIDLMVKNLNNAGYPDVFVEWGEIRASGKHPDGRPWNIYISRLGNTDPNQAIAYVSLNNEAIATSGDYLQNWTVATPGLGQSPYTTFTHIIDPWTFQPLKIESNSLASASVLAPNCTLADALATAAMMFPSIAEANAWTEQIREKYPTLAFWFAVREDKRLSSK